jgi:hypothetical protein
MRITIAVFSAFVAIAAAGTIPVPRSNADFMEPGSSPALTGLLAKRDSYDCKGSSMCKSLQVRACDEAVNNKLIRNNDVNYGAPGYVANLMCSVLPICAACRLTSM